MAWYQSGRLKDIVAEKIKTISQQGAKKAFIDLYAVLKVKHSISEVCNFLRNVLQHRGLIFIMFLGVLFISKMLKPNPIH